MVFFLGISISYAQNLRFDELAPDGEDLSVYGDDITEFQWVRGRYTNHGAGQGGFGRRRGGGWWDTDFPDSDENFLRGVQRYTNVDTNPKNYTYVELTDPQLFENIFLYMNWKRVPIGYPMSGPNFSAPEVTALREFMLRGGFVLVDDFWGQAEWTSFMQNIGTLRADWTVRPIPADHPMLTIVYPLKQCPQIPARIFYQQTGMPWDPPFAHRAPTGGVSGVNRVRFMGLFDKQDRLMVVATHNTDIADGWEREGESKEFFERFSINSYAITINILVYALTH